MARTIHSPHRRARGTRIPAILLLAFSFGIASRAEIIDRVLAIVAGNIITLSDVSAARDLQLISAAPSSDPIRDLLPLLIDRALMLAEVERYAPPEPAADAVDRQVESVRSRFPSAEAFESALARVGYDDRHLRETLRQDLRLAAYLDQRFTVQAPAEADLDRFYREHPDRFANEGQTIPFEQARTAVAGAVRAERRQQLVADWVAGLRRRAEVVDLTSSRPR